MEMLEIRRARRSDAQAAFDIRRLAILDQCGTAYPPEQVQAWTDVPLTEWYRDLVENHFHLVCIQGHPVATGMLDLEKRELGAIFVHPDFMQRGVGMKMVTHLECLARQAELTEINLEATLNAAAFYRRCGFIGDKPSIYQSPSGLQLACMPMVKRLALATSE
nr:GNAT family N-acetyltransferase [Cupriavidus basilensis]